MDQIIQQLERISLNLDDLEKTLCDGIDAIFLKYAANFNKEVDTDDQLWSPTMMKYHALMISVMNFLRVQENFQLKTHH